MEGKSTTDMDAAAAPAPMAPNRRTAPLYIDTRQAAEMLGLAPATLHKDRVCGSLGIPYLKLGHSVRYDPADVKAWAEKRRRTSTSNSGQEAA